LAAGRHRHPEIHLSGALDPATLPAIVARLWAPAWILALALGCGGESVRSATAGGPMNGGDESNGGATQGAGNRVAGAEPDLPVPTKGGVPISVTGRYFLDDTRAFIGALELEQMVRVSDTLLTGLIPAGVRPEPLKVAVVTGAGMSYGPGSFRYVGAPRLRAVHPTVGPTTGGIKMTIAGNDLLDTVKIKFGTSFANALELTMPITHEADDKVTGCLPPGHGTVTVWAVDEVTGDDHLDAAFTYSDGPIDPSSVVLCDSAAPAAP